MDSTNVLRLFASILVPIYCEWIHDIDLGRLDSAVCNKQLRNLFLSFLPLGKVAYLEFCSSESALYKCIWVELRGLGMREVRELRSDFLIPLEKKLLMRIKQLLHLDCSFGVALQELVHVCPNILSLTWKDGKAYVNDDEYCRLISQVHCLQNIAVRHIHSLTDVIVEPTVQCCPNLRSLCFSDCSNNPSFSFDSSALLLRCSNLTSFDVEYRPETMDALLQATNLQHIYLRRRKWNDEGYTDSVVLALACRYPLLQSLGLENSPISEKAYFGIIDSCPALSCLDIPHARISDDCLFAVAAKCALLSKLTVYSVLITDVGVERLSISPLLRVLDLSYCELVTDHGVQKLLEGCKQLECLKLFRVKKVTLASINAFELCLTLRHLSVQVTGATGDAIVSNMRDMESLFLGDLIKMSKLANSSDVWTIGHSTKLSSFHHEIIYKQCPQLVILKIQFMSSFRDSSLSSLIESCPLLTRIHLEHTGITVGALDTLAKSGLMLTHLLIYGFRGIEVDTCHLLAQNVRTLKSVSLPMKLSNEVLLTFANSCTYLRSIDFSLSDITTYGLSYLLRSCSLLSCVKVNDCRALDGEILRVIARLGRRLTILNVQRCPLISSAAVQEFLEDSNELIISFCY